MSRRMSDDERRAFLAEGTRTGKLAVVRKDGSPHVVPVWFVLDGDDLVFTTNADTIKGKALRRDGRAAICVDMERSPYAYVLVAGEVEISTDLDEMLGWATKIAARYEGEESAEEFGRRNAVEGELLVRLRPERIVAIDYVDD
jgi:PPOX class probable F420-dependent enzyme